ncbi:MAG: sugar phosphate isomerase/epimerase [Gammaproteobacteria bacterium]|nr:sugar phosphate isomerase/epimerase [Gammaproteobacteria bacterium]
MQLQLFKTLWGHQGSIHEAIKQTLAAGMHGIEAAAPDNPVQQQAMLELLESSGLSYIAEITTAGSYVPDRRASLQQHLDSLERKLSYSAPFRPLFANCLGGCDAWPEQKSLEFFDRAIALAKQYHIEISFETHRSRSFFNPWVTQRISQQIPELLITADFSHWCVVCERLMDTELDVIHSIADKIKHIHARVGYDQGPQVPDPRAAEYEYALRAHQHWWQIIWQSQINRQFTHSTMTPEFGPDGYLHEQPYTREPVADLWELNCWMAAEEKRHFELFRL